MATYPADLGREGGVFTIFFTRRKSMARTMLEKPLDPDSQPRWSKVDIGSSVVLVANVTAISEKAVNRM